MELKESYSGQPIIVKLKQRNPGFARGFVRCGWQNPSGRTSVKDIRKQDVPLAVSSEFAREPQNSGDIERGVLFRTIFDCFISDVPVPSAVTSVMGNRFAHVF